VVAEDHHDQRRGEELVGDVSVSSALVVPNLGGPPGFVRLAAHPLRWCLLQELTRSDRAVRELTARLHKPQNLVSYHLRKLRDGGLVHAQRSSADGRDTYYTIDLVRCEQQLRATGGALHPVLLLEAAHAAPDDALTGHRPRVLFLCTGNSARSQMAEALLAHLSGGRVEAASAGSHPTRLHPNAVRVMRKRLIDISGNRTKHLDEFVPQRFDAVITLCDRVREICPEFPSHPELVHWSVPDPAQAGPTDRASLPAFERTATELEKRIRFLLPLLTARTTSTTTRRSSHVKR
jgi:ArsR family transcriptional regulator, arsenate/arsenite/antimonite-responsive transcriptional repressor / arsenate reductase (thioredoxin)